LDCCLTFEISRLFKQESRPKRKAALKSASLLNTKVPRYGNNITIIKNNKNLNFPPKIWNLTPCLPSSAHYVGYVDDDETPEMIMKKFAVLEKYERSLKKSTEPSDSSETPPTLPASLSGSDTNITVAAATTSTSEATAAAVEASKMVVEGPTVRLASTEALWFLTFVIA